MFSEILLSAAWLSCLGFVIYYWRKTVTHRQVMERAFDTSQLDDPPPPSAAEPGGLTRWLRRAGYRRPGSAALFLIATLACMLLGVLTAWMFFQAGVAELFLSAVARVPGGIGDIFVPIVYIAPWFLMLALALAPVLIVRRSRRQRVQQVERDLPTTLELLATLSESGVAFDAAVARLLQTRMADRPLAIELRTFQADLLSGRPRTECLRRLGRRLDIHAVSVFVAALVQAEQLGMGIAVVLRRQADDQRERRRERATAFAMSLPVKLMFPLVICFLPGLFVWTLGPFFVQLFQMTDAFVHVREF